MNTNSNPKNTTATPTTRKRKDPKYKRVKVGTRLIPMQPAHVDALASTKAESKYSARGERCLHCWLKSEQLKGHFCAKRVEAQGPKTTDPPMLELPVWEWVKA